MPATGLAYFLVYPVIELAHLDDPKYVKAPGSSCGAEERWRDSGDDW